MAEHYAKAALGGALALDLNRRSTPAEGDREPGSRARNPAKPAGGHLMPAIPLDSSDAIELVELPQFLGGWLESRPR
jgi:hypothetical protein